MKKDKANNQIINWDCPSLMIMRVLGQIACLNKSPHEKVTQLGYSLITNSRVLFSPMSPCSSNAHTEHDVKIHELCLPGRQQHPSLRGHEIQFFVVGTQPSPIQMQASFSRTKCFSLKSFIKVMIPTFLECLSHYRL